jgi:hypothetical protein
LTSLLPAASCGMRMTAFESFAIEVISPND